MSAPLVSVVVPAHNAARWIAETMESVLAQTLAELELIIVNDASTDETSDVARSRADSRVRVIDNERNLGAPETRNRGIAEARGEFLAFLDADDVALPMRLERQIAYLRANPDVGLCGAWAKTFGAREEVWTAHPQHDQIKAEMLFRSGLLQSTVVCRRDALQRFGLHYDPEVRLSEDYDLWTRCADRMRLANLTEVLVRYRIHGDNASIVGSDRLKAFNRTIRRRQVAKLGVEPTPDEARLHDALAEYGPTGPGLVAFELGAVEAWLLKLRDANRRAGHVADAALSTLLYEYWRRCSLGSAGGAVSAAVRFASSPLGRAMPLRIRARDVVKQSLGLPLFPLPRS